jgi:ribosomal protein S12 methylthiotransferase accessory factor
MVAVIGHGLIADTISAHLGGRTANVEDCEAAVVVSDAWQDSSRFADMYRDLGAPWLTVHIELGEAIIGPAVFPGESGCPECMERRRTRAGVNEGYRTALLESVRADVPRRPPSHIVQVVADVVADELSRIVVGERQPRTRQAFLRVRFADLATSFHRFLPDPGCPQCGSLPDDTDEAAILRPSSRGKIRPGGLRSADLSILGPSLLDRYVDPQSGLIQQVRRLEAFGLPVAFAPFGWRDQVDTDNGTGRTLDHRTSGYAAVLEALERYCGLGPGGKRTTVRASYAELGDRAVDPHDFGLYPEDQYGKPGFPYRPFDPDEPMEWVWAHSFRRGGPVLVPESMAYYGRRPDGASPRPAYEISNGCAIGSCPEEAVIHGILEVAERDAFLMTWYGRIPVPEIDVATAADRRLPLLVERVERRSGSVLRLFDTTLEQGIPACWAVACPIDGEPFAALCAAGAGLEPEQACLSAVSELATMLVSMPQRYAEDAERVAAMVDDPDLVRTMHDHGSLYGDARAAKRLDFLWDREQKTALSGRVTKPTADLRDDLTYLVDRYLATGLDVIVVDQTTPEVAAGGLTCVKVLIPGTVPMTFGHRNRRVHGLPRLLTVPHLLGHRASPLCPDELNEHPHPFP